MSDEPTHDEHHADEHHTHEEPSRRDMLKLAWTLTSWTALGASGYVGLRFLASRQTDSPFGEVILAGLVEDFPAGTVTPFNEGQFYLVRAADGGFLALYRKCTHLDCIVLWEEENNRFFCPCHGSIFEADGDVVNPPAPIPLHRFPVEIDERGRVRVDTGTLIERSAAAPGDYSYPPADDPAGAGADEDADEGATGGDGA